MTGRLPRDPFNLGSLPAQLRLTKLAATVHHMGRRLRSNEQWSG
jgi:hypothetical protein